MSAASPEVLGGADLLLSVGQRERERGRARHAGSADAGGLRYLRGWVCIRPCFTKARTTRGGSGRACTEYATKKDSSYKWSLSDCFLFLNHLAVMHSFLFYEGCGGAIIGAVCHSAASYPPLCHRLRVYRRAFTLQIPPARSAALDGAGATPTVLQCTTVRQEGPLPQRTDPSAHCRNNAISGSGGSVSLAVNHT